MSRQSHSSMRSHDNSFFRSGGFSFGFFFGTPRIGGIVRVLPPRHQIVIIGSTRYYFYDDVYYTACPLGYVVVPPPVFGPGPAMAAQGTSGEVIVINIPNRNGGYTPVTLVRLNDGYLGPQGEYYPAHPTVPQLIALYGK